MPRNSNKLVFSVGVKGNGIAAVNGKLTKAYTVWKEMLRRCYDPEWLSRFPTYTGCSVCSEWFSFPVFKKWFDENYVEGFQLDKDLLIAGNKIYGPDTCVFAPQSINKLFTDSGKTRGEFPIGVSFHKLRMKFIASICIDGKLKWLGYFDNPEDAHYAYLIAKKANIIRMAEEWRGKIPSKLYDALLTKAGE